MDRTLIVALIATSFVLQPLSAFAAEPITSSSTLEVLMAKVEELENIVKELQLKLVSNKRALLAAVGASTPGTGIGQRAQTTLSTSVKSTPSHTAPSRGTVPAGAIGTVSADYTETVTAYVPAGCANLVAVIASAGCTLKTTYYAWKKMNFDTGVDGWVLANTVTAAVSGKYVIGDRTITVGNDNIRSTPNGTLLGTQPYGSSGTVTGSPVAAGGSIWWLMNYDSGVDGWVAEQNTLNQGVPLTLPPPTLVSLTAPLSSDPATRATQLSAIGMTDAQATLILDGLKAEGAVPPSTYNPTELVPQWAKNWSSAGNYIAGFTEDASGHEVYFVATKEGVKLTMEVDANQFGSVWTVKDPANGEIIAFMGAVVGTDGATYVDMTRVNGQGQLETLPLERISLDAGQQTEVINEVLKGAPVPVFDTSFPENMESTYGVVTTINQDPAVPDYVQDGNGTIRVPDGCTSSGCEVVETGLTQIAPLMDFSGLFLPAFGVVFHTKLPH